MCIQVELHSLHCHIHHAGVKASQQKNQTEQSTYEHYEYLMNTLYKGVHSLYI